MGTLSTRIEAVPPKFISEQFVAFCESESSGIVPDGLLLLCLQTLAE